MGRALQSLCLSFSLGPAQQFPLNLTSEQTKPANTMEERLQRAKESMPGIKRGAHSHAHNLSLSLGLSVSWHREDKKKKITRKQAAAAVPVVCPGPR